MQHLVQHCEISLMSLYKHEKHTDITTAIKNFCVKLLEKTTKNEEQSEVCHVTRA